MSRCTNRACRHPLPSAARFCPRCGSRAPRGGGTFVIAMLIGFVGLAVIGLLTAVRVQGGVPSAGRIDYDSSNNLSMGPFGPHGNPLPAHQGH